MKQPLQQQQAEVGAVGGELNPVAVEESNSVTDTEALHALCEEIAGEEYYALDEPVPLHAHWNGEDAGQARIWAERLRPLAADTQIIATYGESNGWLDGGAAVTLHATANGGKVIYVGAWLDDSLQNGLTDRILTEAGVEPLMAGAPEGVEVTRRVTEEGRTVYLIINHNRHEAEIPLIAPLPKPAHDLLTSAPVTDTLPLVGYGVSVLTSWVSSSSTVPVSRNPDP